jgi:apolipoprotein L
VVRIQKLQTKFDTLVEQWIRVHDVTIEKIEQTIEKLKEHHRNVNISRITGSSVSIAGSLMAIVGFGLAPVTFGASIGLSVGGIALAVAGGSTVAGASIADAFLQKSNIKHVQDWLDHDYKQLDEISQTVKAIKKEIDDIRQKCPGISTREFAAVFGVVIIQGVAPTSSVAVTIAELGAYGTMEISAIASKVGSAAARGIAAADIVLNVILLPINLVEIIVSSFSLARGSQTKAIKQLTHTVQQLKEQKKAIEDLHCTSIVNVEV